MEAVSEQHGGGGVSTNPAVCVTGGTRPQRAARRQDCVRAIVCARGVWCVVCGMWHVVCGACFAAGPSRAYARQHSSTHCRRGSGGLGGLAPEHPQRTGTKAMRSRTTAAPITTMNACMVRTDRESHGPVWRGLSVVLPRSPCLAYLVGVYSPPLKAACGVPPAMPHGSLTGARPASVHGQGSTGQRRQWGLPLCELGFAAGRRTWCLGGSGEAGAWGCVCRTEVPRHRTARPRQACHH